MKRTGVVVAVMGVAALLPSSSIGSHSGSTGGPREFAVGASKGNLFRVTGPAHLIVSAHRDPSSGRVTGHVRAKGDLDGPGPGAPFGFEGEVTCVRVEGNRAAVKYAFKHAFGSAEPLTGGGVQVFIEDNGEPSKGTPDRVAFDPPQPAGVFQTNAQSCDDPTFRPDYNPAESGNYNVHDMAG